MPADRDRTSRPPDDDDDPSSTSGDDVPVDDEDAEDSQDDDEDAEDSQDAESGEAEVEATVADVADAWDIGGTRGPDDLPSPADFAADPPDLAPRLRDPGAWPRRLVALQVALVLSGSLPWWALLYWDLDVEAAELAWFAAAAVGALVAVYGHLQRLHWLSAFGFVTSASVLLLQMRGAGLLLAYGVGTFSTLLVAALATAALLAALATREITLVT